MAGFFRLLLGIALLPACWGVSLVFVDSVRIATASDGALGVESLSLIGGAAIFALAWAVLPHPVKTYVFGHELTHALWGLCFGARVGKVRVSASGGSVNLSKTNVFITLAPYFFPFYTFIVLIAACVVDCFVHPLPLMPLWLFLVGLTWAFHILFTIETLIQKQPDVKLYGRVFSWTFIFLANLAFLLIWLASTTPLTFESLYCLLLSRVGDAYRDILSLLTRMARFLLSLV